ncbi:hypothetical protein DX933_02255 [Ornithinibacillus gellani]|uniref:hypothetical protein n=1 Tax=Ornithinibacillus gellani TaxID=2293253 RepID=UPI000F46A4E4|nr:hypothetical protein [Ornithinibacillus gellani]TQS76268.1 hypothetical protein DX933_02255 [Ornithinibacillus gellani]
MTEEKIDHDKNRTYVEVIGDTVYGKHLIMTITISVSFSLIGYFIGKQVFPSIAPAEMVKSYALLLGIAGSLIALFINTLLFKPKRTLNEVPNTSDELENVYKQLHFDIEEERQSILDDPVIAQEMKEQGIYNMFMKEEEDKQK